MAVRGAAKSLVGLCLMRMHDWTLQKPRLEGHFTRSEEVHTVHLGAHQRLQRMGYP